MTKIEKVTEQVISWTGIVGEEAKKIALIAMEYSKPHKGKWKDDT